MVKALISFIAALVAACGGGTANMEIDMDSPSSQATAVATFAAG